MAWVEKTSKDKGHAWRFGYRGPDRRQRYKTFTRKADADLFAATIETDMSRGDWTDRHPAAVGTKARKVEPWPRPKASRRIELDLPLSATKEEVADRYVQVRDEMLRDEPKSRRSLTQDTSDLAVFAARHRSGCTWEEARAIWNDHRTGAKQRRYDDPAPFMRDSRKTYERVTGEKLDWIGKSAGHTPPLRNESKET